MPLNKNFSRGNIARLDPYVPGYQPENPDQVIKLNANENPYPPSSLVLEALRRHIGEDLRLYPNSGSHGLRRQAAEVYDLKPEQVFAANGSDEIISLIFRSFVEPNDHVLFPYPTYTFYETACQIHGVSYQVIETGKSFEIDLNKFLNIPAKLMFIANPNAHTGVLLPRASIEAFLDTFTGLLVVDEAYIDFGGEKESVYRLIEKYDNLLVLRTFSKSFSLCGIRVGYAFGHPRLIETLDKTKDSYNIAYLNQIAAVEGLKDISHMQSNARRITRSREWFSQSLMELGFDVIPSRGNFLLIHHPGRTARDIYTELKARNILVRWFDQPRLRDYVRISIGTDRQLKTVLNALKEILSETGISFE